MKAAFLTEPMKIEIRNIQIPETGPEDLLIKIKRVAICGSDNHIYKKGEIAMMKVDLPFILGHECSGEIVGMGEEVKGFKIGDRVAIEPPTICGKCEFCLSGRYNLCDNYKFLAAPPDTNGAFSEFIVHNYNRCFLLPNDISYEEGALVEPLSIIIQAFEISNFKIGDDVLIIGSSSIGLLILMLVKAFGAGKCFIADINDFKLKVARKLGADFALNISNINIKDFINSHTSNKGVSVIFDSVGANTTLDNSILAAKKGATIVIIGITDDKSSFDIVQLICKMLTIKGTTDFVNTFPKAINLIKNKKIDVMSIVTDVFDFKDLDKAFKNMNSSSKTIKTMISFD